MIKSCGCMLLSTMANERQVIVLDRMAEMHQARPERLNL